MTGQPNQQPKGPIRDAWRQFWVAVFEPWTVVLLFSTLVLFGITQFEIKGAANTLAQVLLAASSGVLGGRVANRISAIAGEGILKARGTVSVRSLRLLHQYAASLEARVTSFLAQKDLIRGNPEVTERAFEEVISGCRHIQEHALTSIDNWTDTVPAAGQAVASITVANAARAEVEAATERVRALEEELRRANDNVAAQGAERDQEFARVQGELETARKELVELRASARQANSGLTSDIWTTSAKSVLNKVLVDLSEQSARDEAARKDYLVQRNRMRTQAKEGKKSDEPKGKPDDGGDAD